MNKILAVVVTYNRLIELKICLSSLRKQSRKDFDILVVNNGSTDKTKDWLDGQSDILVINQENLGGSGGFYTGEKYGYDNGYEWVWLMDDDGIAEPKQLEVLFDFIKACPDAKVLNALVVNKDNHDELSFMLGDWNFKDTQEVDYVSGINPYNGTLIHRDVFAAIGFTKKEMFIWGDEIEFDMRIASAGYDRYTVTHAYHYHPRERSLKRKVFPPFLNYEILIKPRHFSKYYYRNQGYIHQVYYRTKWYKGLKPMFYYSIYFLRKFDFSEAFKVVKYYIRGINNNFKNE